MSAEIHPFPRVTRTRAAADVLPAFDAAPLRHTVVEKGDGYVHLEFHGDFEPARLRLLASRFIALADQIEIESICADRKPD